MRKACCSKILQVLLKAQSNYHGRAIRKGRLKIGVMSAMTFRVDANEETHIDKCLNKIILIQLRNFISPVCLVVMGYRLF